MPLSLDATHVLFVSAVLFLAALVGASMLGAIHAWLETRQRHAEIRAAPTACRHCRYCRKGEAYLHDESVKYEDHDRVTVRCYVCSSCGLPQWFVQREPVTRYAES
jgi:hypothetical protein